VAIERLGNAGVKDALLALVEIDGVTDFLSRPIVFGSSIVRHDLSRATGVG
jgi:hypothetical protein